MSFKRPSAKDSDQDLLELQNEFLKTKTAPSATFVRMNKTNGTNDTNEKSSIPGEKNDDDDSSSSSVLTSIIEHKPIFHNILAQPIKSNAINSSFPRPFKRSLETDEKTGDSKQKKSIFSREMSKRKDNKTVFIDKPMEVDTPIEVESACSANKDQSILVDGTGLNSENSIKEATTIHFENLAKIDGMPAEEIHSVRKKLLEEIDPKIVQFLKSKRQVLSSEVFPQMTEKNKLPEVKSEMNISSDEIVDEKDIPIPLREVEKNKWLNMNKIEWKKLAWMKELSSPKPMDPSTGNSARFDLDGNLMTGINNVPVHLGLHHHGEEPELPGYTFEELFQLCRSKLPSQRCLALKTMSYILFNNSNGSYDEVLSAPLLAQLIDSGITLLLRFSLDDEQIFVICAAVKALHALLVCIVDEACLDHAFSWPAEGYVAPFLIPPDSPLSAQKPNDYIEKMMDNQIVQLDVVLGLVRMDFLPRLRYILTVIHPDASVVGQILEILIRLARHSSQSAEQIMMCPMLISFIVESFMPLKWIAPECIQGKISTVYGMPLYLAVKLIRVLASANQEIANNLINQYNVQNSLSCYLAADPTDNNMPSPEMLKICIESCRAWRVFLSYDLIASAFEDLLPIWMRHLRFCYAVNIATPSQIGDMSYAAALLTAIEGFIQLSLSRQGEIGHTEVGRFDSIFSMVFEVCQKWSAELITNSSPNYSEGYVSLAAAMGLLSCDLKICNASNNAETALKKNLLLLKTIINSDCFLGFSSKLISNSSIINDDSDPSNQRYSLSLCSLNTVQWGGREVTACMKNGSNLPVFIAISKTIITCVQTLKNANLQNIDKLNTDVYQLSIVFLNTLKPYLKSVSDTLLDLGNLCTVNWFQRFEIKFILNALKIVSLLVSEINSIDKIFYHELAISVCPLVLSFEDTKELVHNLWNSIVFNPTFYILNNDADLEEARIKLSNLLSPQNVPNENFRDISYCENKLAKTLIENLSENNSDFKFSLKVVSDEIISTTKTLSTVAHFRKLKNDKTSWADTLNWQKEWMFLPLLQPLFDRNEISDQLTADRIGRFLSWLHFILSQRSPKLLINQSGLVICRISSVFVIGDEMFLDSKIQELIPLILQKLFTIFPKIELDEKHLNFSFQDLYKDLLNQFESVSYGNSVFASAVIIPLQSTYPSSWKKMFFSEHQNIIPLLRTNLKQTMAPVESYFKPIETDSEVLELYFRFLLQGSFSRCQLLYVIAVHHLHNALFNSSVLQDSASLLKILRTIVHFQSKKECCLDILKYKLMDPEAQRGILLHEHIPAHVQELCVNIKKR